MKSRLDEAFAQEREAEVEILATVIRLVLPNIHAPVVLVDEHSSLRLLSDGSLVENDATTISMHDAVARYGLARCLGALRYALQYLAYDPSQTARHLFEQLSATATLVHAIDG